MTVYAVKDLPNIDDPNLIRCCACVQNMRRTLSDFIQHIIPQLSQHPVTTSVRVALAIMFRMMEGSLSIELLCLKNRVRDAAILLLSLHELQLDLQYIALDLSRAAIWLDHTSEDKKPWRVTMQMKEIYTVANELDADRWLYRLYSMVKHGNPAGTNLAFPIAAKRDSLQLDRTGNNSPMIPVQMFGLAAHIENVGKAASSIWVREGLDVGGFALELTEQCKTLSEYNEQHIITILQQTAASRTFNDDSLSITVNNEL